MRRSLKFLHTLAACGLVGALLAYATVLLYAPQATPRSYAEARQTISLLCDYLLLPSMAVALVTGLLAMAVHGPFRDTRWAWLKALLGLSLFEATLGIVQSKATTAAAEAANIAAGQAQASVLEVILANEWSSLAAILALSIAQIVLGVWRPRLANR
jgi:uncharacterized membrane protein